MAEYSALGFPADQQYTRFAEALEVILELLRGGTSDFSGRWTQLEGAVAQPQGPQGAALPIMIAAHGPKMVRLAARHADTWSWYTFQTAKPEVFAPQLEALAAACEAEGRSYDSMRKSVSFGVATTDDLGADRGWEPPLQGSPQAVADQLMPFAAAGINELQLFFHPQSASSVEFLASVLEHLD